MFYKNKLVPKAKFLSGGPRDMPPLLFVGAEGQETKDEDSPSYFNKYEASKVVDKVCTICIECTVPMCLCVSKNCFRKELISAIKIFFERNHPRDI